MTVSFLPNCAALIGVLVSIAFTVGSTPNPAQIPFRLYFPRALWGLSLTFVLWGPIAFGLMWPIAIAVQSIVVGCLIGLLLGLALPQAGWLKSRLPSRAAQSKLQLFEILQAIDEQTRLYVSKIISREERKVSVTFLGQNTNARRHSLDRLYEYLNVEIACSLVEELPPGDHAAALDLFRVRHHPVKFKYLMRHLGYRKCLQQLLILADEPLLVFPTWPFDEGDRRRNDQARHPRKRRKYEQPALIRLVLGIGAEDIRAKHQVFVSSTFLDLKDHRQEVQRALLRADCIPAGMEIFPTSDEELWSLICGVIEESDYYLLLIGGRYGSAMSSGESFTEAEYDYALQAEKPILAFFHLAPETLLEGLEAHEPAEHRERLRKFKERVQRTHSPGYWREPKDLGALVLQAIAEVRKKHPASGWQRISRR